MVGPGALLCGSTGYSPPSRAWGPTVPLTGQVGPRGPTVLLTLLCGPSRAHCTLGPRALLPHSTRGDQRRRVSPPSLGAVPGSSGFRALEGPKPVPRTGSWGKGPTGPYWALMALLVCRSDGRPTWPGKPGHVGHPSPHVGPCTALFPLPYGPYGPLWALQGLLTGLWALLGHTGPLTGLEPR